MKFETITTPTKELFVESDHVNVSAYAWANGEGASFLVHGKAPDLPLRMAGSFRWEELDVIIMALTAIRTVP